MSKILPPYHTLYNKDLHQPHNPDPLLLPLLSHFLIHPSLVLCFHSILI